MKTRYFGAFLAATMLVLSGCASMSADECMTSDWYAVGYEDGARGYGAEQLSNRRQACAKHGVTADFQAYQSGRTEGLKEFCQPQRGFNIGSSGGRYSGVCPSHLEPGFLDAFRVGAQLHTLRSNLNSANYRISARQAELASLEDDIRSKEAALIAAETSVQDRILIVADLKELNERTGQLDAEILGLIEDRIVHEQELASYEQVLADTGY
ncbi:MAG: DUF2799 domain-containing protein [Pseudomonadota bacterium]